MYFIHLAVCPTVHFSRLNIKMLSCYHCLLSHALIFVCYQATWDLMTQDKVLLLTYSQSDDDLQDLWLSCFIYMFQCGFHTLLRWVSNSLVFRSPLLCSYLGKETVHSDTGDVEMTYNWVFINILAHCIISLYYRTNISANVPKTDC